MNSRRAKPAEPDGAVTGDGGPCWETRLRALFNAVPEGVVFQEPDGRVTLANRAACQTLMLNLEELQGKASAAPFGNAIRADGSPFPDEEHPATVSLRTAVEVRGVVMGLQFAGRGTRWIQVDSVPVMASDSTQPQGVFTTFRDVTEIHPHEAEAERSRLQTQLAQAQKMESVGRLAGGVAHDFNNLLTVILACAEELREAVREGRPLPAVLIDDILATGRRAADVTGQLLSFSRQQVIRPEVIDPNALLGENRRFLARILGEDIRIIERLEAAPWAVRADKGQMSQVIVDLAANARDAMPAGGTLTLATENVELGPGDLPEPGLSPGAYVRFTVQDTGTGMNAEVLRHVFEPFFTTKATGKGGGLGLATVYGIVRQNEGFVTVRSIVGKGTTFDVYLPRVASEQAAAPLCLSVPPHGHETVLVVEDDEMLRNIMVRTLRRAGYKVLAAGEADEAVDVVRGEHGPVHAVVTDVVMPGADGREVARRVAQLRPEIRVLYVSGYAHDSIGPRGVIEEGLHFLPKPFTRASLLWRVRSVLDDA